MEQTVTPVEAEQFANVVKINNREDRDAATMDADQGHTTDLLIWSDRNVLFGCIQLCLQLHLYSLC